jgi:GT2 family glycosyltransferase
MRDLPHTDLVSREYRHPPSDRDPLFTNSMGAAPEIVARVGKMDEHPSVRYAEDVDWGYRALVPGIVAEWRRSSS